MNALNGRQKPPDLSVVLVNHNGKAFLGKCLSSIRENSGGIDLEVIVVDNRSTDGSPDWIAGQFPWVKLIRNRENLGFSKANNIGFMASCAGHVLFLNTDTVIFPGALPRLVREIEENPLTGAVGPALVAERGKYQVSFGNRVNFFGQLIQKGILNTACRVRLRSRKKRKEVGWLSAACLLVTRRAFAEAGMFDERFFLYFEDIDLCFRMREKGFKLVFLPEARVFHAGGASTSQMGYRNRLEYRRSQLYFYKKHNSRISFRLLRLYLKGCLFFQSHFGRLRGRKNDAIRALFQDALRERWP